MQSNKFSKKVSIFAPMYDIIVIGGGPAGLMASITAAEAGAKGLLLEKMEKPARKLRITGKGRCNITNIKTHEEFLTHIFPDSSFFEEAFSQFSNKDLLAFLNQTGIATVVERGQRVFPSSQSAPAFAESLIRRAKSAGVEILCNSRVTALFCTENAIDKLVYKQSEKPYSVSAKAFIVSTGGLSYPATGSTGDGYLFARKAGLVVRPQRPSLVHLSISDLHQPRSLSLRNISLRLQSKDETLQEEFGEMESCGSYISGPCVLRLSRKAGEFLSAKSDLRLVLDLKPSLSRDQLLARIDRELLQAPSNVGLGYLLGKLMPRDLALSFALKFQLSSGKNLRNISRSEINKIVSGLKEYILYVNGTGSFKDAIVTAGGVSLSEIHAESMRAKKLKNLYFAGEVLDLDADTGGYNLQIAFSTGFLAGSQAALACREMVL